MKHTAFGHSITFYAQDWDKYPEISVDGDGKPKYGLEKNTWESWHLIPESRPTLPHPKQKTKIISDIPSINGNIDLSLKDKPYPLFENREGSFSFIYNPIYSYAANDFRDWTVLYTEISRFIHGRQLRMILEDDPGWYWEGRFNIEGWTSNTDGSGSVITIGYSVQPYKMEIFTSLGNWLWDPFNFYNGVISKTVFDGITIASLNNPSEHGSIDKGNLWDEPPYISPYWYGYNKNTNVWEKKENWTASDSDWTHGMSERFGDMPQIPIVWWKPEVNPVTNKSKARLIVNYVNDPYKINYKELKYKYYDPSSALSDAVTRIGNTSTSDGFFKFKDNDLILCDNYVNGDQYIHFVGNGEIKIEFRRGSL